MANYFLQGDGSLTKKKKKKGNSYELQDNGTLRRIDTMPQTKPKTMEYKPGRDEGKLTNLPLSGTERTSPTIKPFKPGDSNNMISYQDKGINRFGLLDIANKILGVDNSQEDKFAGPVFNQTAPEEAIKQATQAPQAPTYEVNEDGYIKTNKKYGDYYYLDYEKMGNYDIYKKDDKYYYHDGKQYNEITNHTGSYMGSKEWFAEQKRKAEKLGYKDNKSKLSVLDQLKLDTDNLTAEEYDKYESDLERQAKKKEKELANKNKVRYGGAGPKGSIGELINLFDNAKNNIDKNVITPVKNAPESFNLGKMNEELGKEYYKKMNGEENNVEELEEKIRKYSKFNEDIAYSDNLIDQSAQNVPNQFGGTAAGIKGGGPLAAVGGIIGAAIGFATTKETTGTLTGAKIGAKYLGGSGYVAGSAKYTYELESGYQYKTLLEMGVPEDIAKEEAKKVGTVNALIESGESILDLITMGQASAAKELLKESLTKKYGKEVVTGWLKNAAVSYVTNSISEGVEEGTQEYVSIESEKRATKKAGIERDDSGDWDRIKDSAVVASFSALISGGVTNFAPTVVKNTISDSNINKVAIQQIETIEKQENIKLTAEQKKQMQQEIVKGVKEKIYSSTGYNQQEQNVVDTFVNERVSETQKQNTLENELKKAIESRETAQGGSLSDKNKKALREGILAKIESGEIDTSSIKLSKKELSKIEEEVKKNLSDGKYALSKIEDILTPTETAKLKELESSLANTKDNTQKAQIQAQIKELKTSRLISLKNMMNYNQFLNKAVYETEMFNKKYSYDETKVTDGYEKGVRESAKEKLNNTTETRKLVDIMAKLSKDRQTSYKFTNNQELLEQGDLVEKTDLTKEEKSVIQNLEKQLESATTQSQKKSIQNQINDIKYLDVGGFVRTNVDGKQTVLINIDSNQAINTILGHETKHLLEKNSLNKEFNKLLFDYAKTKGDYDTYRKRIEGLYEGIANANIDNELAAVLTGDYLFTDSKFIESLMNDKSSNSPKIVQKLKEIIDDLVVRFKGTEQEKQLRELQKKFKELYKQNGNDTNVVTKDTTETQYMVTGKKGNKQLDKKFGTNEFINNYNEALSMEKDNVSNKKIREKTGWYKDVNGDWKFEISDESAKLKVEPKANTTYKLSDLLSHDYIFDMYKNLEDTKVVFKDLGETRGRANKITGTISINNNLVNDTQQLKKTLIHEIQHNIQRAEGFQQGTTKAIQNGNYERYKNNFGETEARETADRLDLTFQERQDSPSYTSTYEEGISKQNLYSKKDNKWYNLLGGNSNEIVTENPQENQTNNRYDNVGRVNEELDNSSFFSGENKQYSLSDNQGRILTIKQQEYFKDVIPELKDENNSLKVLYHGSPNAFTQFNYDFIGSNGTALGKGFYLTDDENIAKGYTGDNGNVMEVYANITKPMSLTELNITKAEYKKLVKAVDKATDGQFLSDYGEVDYEGYNTVLNRALESYEYNDNDVDLVHDVFNTASLSWEDGFRLLKNTLGYDGVISKQGFLSEEGTVYVPTLPEQIKSVTNQNPTDNLDINLSLSNPNEDIGPVGDYNVYGDDIKYTELPFDANVVKSYREAFDQAVRESAEGVARELGYMPKDPTKESSYDNPTSAEEWKAKAMKRSIEQKVEDTIRKHSYRNAASTSMLGRKLLDFNEQERRTFRDSILDLTSKPKEDLINANSYNKVRDIINQYANRELNFIDDELVAAKQDVRKYRIKVDKALQKQITDFGDFRKNNFGNLTIANDGQSIDEVWQELNEAYPYYFRSDITAEADMLYALSEFMQKDVTITEKYRLSDKEIEGITKKIYNKILHNALSQQDLEFAEQDIADQVERRTRQVVQEELLEEMGITDDILDGAKHISQIDLMRTDPIRVNEKIFGWKNGQIINDATVRTTIKHEAERIRFLEQERNEIKELGIKARSKESAAVQKYGEKQYVNKYGEVVPYTAKELAEEFHDVETQNKIKRAAKILRRKYDTYIDIVNNELERMGYDPIPKRKDYMRHFQEMTDIFSKLGTPLNPTSLNENNLPTDINGLTDEFKPGKSWFANAQQRKGMKTIYDAITGIDGYLESVSNVIYHTEDIQRYRTLAKHIRNIYSDHVLEDYDVLRDEEKIEAFDKAYKGSQGYLAQYVAWLDEQANALAGKKGKIDRGVEETFGRKVYSVLNDAKKQVGSNMTGFNVRSAMTNFASAVQGMSKTKKLAWAKGTLSTFNNIIHDDGLINKSDFLTTRFGSEQLSTKTWQKLSNYGQIFMTGSDYFTANQIWRSKYFENLSSGMSEDTAIKNADDFAARIMGNRAKGTTAQIFNSKTLGLFTQFQLEVNNQWSSIIHDNQMEIEKGQIEGKTGKAAASVIFNLGQLAVFSNIFNTIMKSLTGSDVMIDPIELFKNLFGIGDDDDDEEKSISERFFNVMGELVDDMPFASIFTGGRIPIAEAFKGVSTLSKKVTGQTDEFGQEYTWDDVWSDMFESGMYWILPTGYGQLKKTYTGTKMYDDDLPIAGSYTDSGNLRFTADEDLASKIKAGLFGQWANDEAEAYRESGYKSINKNSIEELKDLDMKSSEYRKLKTNINNSGKKTKDKVNFIADLDELTNSQKNTLVNNILDRDYEVDVSNYKDYSSYEEFDFSYKKPEKYSFLRDNNISYKEYTASEESKEAYDWAYNNPEKYSLAKAMTNDVIVYKQYASKINDIEADKDRNGKSISGSRKSKVIKYVNSLNLSIPQKAMMIRQEYSSYKDYNKQIVDYVSELNLPYQEKITILEELDMKVNSNGYVSWK